MVRFLLLLVFTYFASSVIAQNNFVVTGGDISNPGGTVSNSIGQLVYKSVSNASSLLIEGLQQPYELAGPLPVTLLYFTAIVSGENTVALNWTSASEFNSKDFQVERSIDGINFQMLTSVLAAGNSSSNIDYKVIDQNPPNGIIYYRLKQTDLDGKYEYSQIEKVIFQSNSSSISAGPNPATDHVMLFLQYDHSLKTNCQVVSLDGKVLKQEKVTGNATRINMSNLAKGTYLMKVIQNNQVLKSFKIVKQ